MGQTPFHTFNTYYGFVFKNLKKKSNYPFPSVEKKKSEFSLLILYPLLLICHVFFKIGSEIIFFYYPF